MNHIFSYSAFYKKCHCRDCKDCKFSILFNPMFLVYIQSTLRGKGRKRETCNPCNLCNLSNLFNLIGGGTVAYLFDICLISGFSSLSLHDLCGWGTNFLSSRKAARAERCPPKTTVAALVG